MLRPQPCAEKTGGKAAAPGSLLKAAPRWEKERDFTFACSVLFLPVSTSRLLCSKDRWQMQAGEDQVSMWRFSKHSCDFKELDEIPNVGNKSNEVLRVPVYMSLGVPRCVWEHTSGFPKSLCICMHMCICTQGFCQRLMSVSL
jgi:hypothetical protein